MEKLPEYIKQLLDELDSSHDNRYAALNDIIINKTKEEGYLDACKYFLYYIEQNHTDLYGRIQKM